MAKLLLVVFIFCLASCSGMVIERHLFGNYYLAAPDVYEQSSLGYRNPGEDGYVIIIEETVVAAGFNKEYIIAKQYKGSPTDYNYYILPIRDGSEPDRRDVIGPLTQKEFEQKKEELKIKNLDFTVFLKDLE